MTFHAKKIKWRRELWDIIWAINKWHLGGGRNREEEEKESDDEQGFGDNDAAAKKKHSNPFHSNLFPHSIPPKAKEYN